MTQFNYPPETAKGLLAFIFSTPAGGAINISGVESYPNNPLTGSIYMYVDILLVFSTDKRD